MRLLTPMTIFILLLFGFMAFAQKPVKKPTDKPVIEYYLPQEDIYPVEVQIYRDTIIYRVLTIQEGQLVLLDTNILWLQPMDTIWRWHDPFVPLWDSISVDTSSIKEEEFLFLYE